MELGDLLVWEEKDRKIILRVFSLTYASQIDISRRELISGMMMNGESNNNDFYDPETVHYMIAGVNALVSIVNGVPEKPKTLPTFFGNLRIIKSSDLDFLPKTRTG